VWNEPSPSSDLSGLNQQTNGKKFPMPALIDSVEADSIGEALGLQAGDKLLSINGVKPRDLIDYKFLISEEQIKLEIIDKEGKLHQINFEKESDDGLGISFSEALFDGLKQCNNKCSFCFIDQQPSGKRKTLYLKDDDYRLSFLYGSYLTLTNLNDHDWLRIEKQHLSPLFVSVHATEPSLRVQLLKNSQAGNLMTQIHWFSEHNLQIHAQIVICPGLNDGKELEKSLEDLFKYAQGAWPTVISTAIVPVGLTRFRPSNDGLKPVNKTCAKKIITQVENMQNYFKTIIGSRFAWLSDEWYLIAEEPLPLRDDYEDLPQEENGVGSIRAFLESIDIATNNLPQTLKKYRRCSWVVGKIVKHALTPTCQKLNEIEGLEINLYGLPSKYWGQEQVVTGLLTGRDLLEGLKNEDLGEELLLPSVMLKPGQAIFLDDMSVEELSDSLHVPIRIVNSAYEIINAALGEKSTISHN
tara:strand:+ start:21128 stop:22534 length:1407 start_codon:yes stop_codon:yes gene_type:complete